MSERQSDRREQTDARTTGRTATADRWLDDRPVSDASLPADVADITSRFYGVESVETLGDFVTATRAEAGGGSISIEDLCHVTEETPHVATTADDTYHFRCFYDGIVLARLTDGTVEVRTESPSGEVIELRATSDGDVEAAPPEAVMSFGIATDAAGTAHDAPTAEAVYGAICPYVKAFPSRERYGNWAVDLDAATVGLPLAAGAPIAAALTEGD